MTPQEFKFFFGYIDYWQTFYYPSHLFAVKLIFTIHYLAPPFCRAVRLRGGARLFFLLRKNKYYNSKFYLLLKVTPDNQ